MAAATNAVVASCAVAVPTVAVGAAGVPVNTGEATSAPPAADRSPLVRLTVPVRPLNDSTELAVTQAVVASRSELSVGGGVGAVGAPVKVVLLKAPTAVRSDSSRVTRPDRPFHV